MTGVVVFLSRKTAEVERAGWLAGNQKDGQLYCGDRREQGDGDEPSPIDGASWRGSAARRRRDDRAHDSLSSRREATSAAVSRACGRARPDAVRRAPKRMSAESQGRLAAAGLPYQWRSYQEGSI
jgi:hypothetical protein